MKAGKKITDVMQLARPTVLELEPYASAKDEFKDFDRDLIFIDANENPFENGMNRYPDPNQSRLKERISELKQIVPERILLGNGSDEILDLIFRATAEERRVIVRALTRALRRCGKSADAER